MEIYRKALINDPQIPGAEYTRADAELASNQQDLILRTAQAYLDVPGATDAADSAKAGVAIETGRLPFGALHKFGRTGC